MTRFSIVNPNGDIIREVLYDRQQGDGMAREVWTQEPAGTPGRQGISIPIESASEMMAYIDSFLNEGCSIVPGWK